VITIENKARIPLNNLLRLLDQSIKRDDPEITRMMEHESSTTNLPIDSTPFHHVSTHNNIKESLYRANKMKFRSDRGFVGPIRDIFRYKSVPQKVKTLVDVQSRKCLDLEEFSM
jgi:hypothetical protein